MSNAFFGIAVELIFFLLGIKLIKNPEAFLAQLKRPATDKHIRVTRFIGTCFLIFVLVTTLQLLRVSR